MSHNVALDSDSQEPRLVREGSVSPLGSWRRGWGLLWLGRLRLRGPRGAQFEFTLAAIAQNLRRLAKLAARPPPLVASCVA